MFELSVETVFREGWKRYVANLGESVLYTLGYAVGVFIVLMPILAAIVGGIGFSFFRAAIADPENPPFEQVLAAIGPGLIVTVSLLLLVAMIVLPAWSAGWMYALRKMLLGEKPRFSDLFSQFGKIIHLVVVGIITGLLALVVIVFVAATFAIFLFSPFLIPFMGILTNIFILGGLAIYVLISQAFLLIVDRNLDVFSAIATSWHRITKSFWRVLAALVLLYVASVATTQVLVGIPFGGLVNLLLAMPYFTMAHWVLYFALFPPPKVAPLAAPEVPPPPSPPPPPPGEPTPPPAAAEPPPPPPPPPPAPEQ